MKDEDKIALPDPRASLIAGGFSGIVAPGECGCRLDDLKPCGALYWDCDKKTGIPNGCQPGYAHTDPSGKTIDWLVSIKKEPPSQEVFDECMNSF